MIITTATPLHMGTKASLKIIPRASAVLTLHPALLLPLHLLLCSESSCTRAGVGHLPLARIYRIGWVQVALNPAPQVLHMHPNSRWMASAGSFRRTAQTA